MFVYFEKKMTACQISKESSSKVIASVNTKSR